MRSTPVYDGENLYVGGMRDYLVCLDAKSGGKKVERRFHGKIRLSSAAFGFVCSPMVMGDHLYAPGRFWSGQA